MKHYIRALVCSILLIPSAHAGESSGGGLGSAFQINLESFNFDQIKNELALKDAQIYTTRDVDTYTPIAFGQRSILLESWDGKKAIISQVNSVNEETKGQLFFDPDQVTIEVDEENSGGGLSSGAGNEGSGGGSGISE